VQLAELPQGSTEFKTIALSDKPKYHMGNAELAWDGTHLAMHRTTAYNYDYVYRYRIIGTAAQLDGQVGPLESDMVGFSIWKEAGLMFCVLDANGGYVVVYHYPAGGRPIAQLNNGDGGNAVVFLKP
jgi:hypothetical protein